MEDTNPDSKAKKDKLLASVIEAEVELDTMLAAIEDTKGLLISIDILRDEDPVGAAENVEDGIYALLDQMDEYVAMRAHLTIIKAKFGIVGNSWYKK